MSFILHKKPKKIVKIKKGFHYEEPIGPEAPFYWTPNPHADPALIGFHDANGHFIPRKTDGSFNVFASIPKERTSWALVTPEIVPNLDSLYYDTRYAHYRAKEERAHRQPSSFAEWIKKEIAKQKRREENQLSYKRRVAQLGEKFANPEQYLKDLQALERQFPDKVPQKEIDALNAHYDRFAAQERATYAINSVASKGFELQNTNFAAIPEDPNHPDFVSLDIETTGVKQKDSTTGVAAVRYRWNPYEKRYVISNVFNRFYFAKGGNAEYLYNAEGIAISKYDKARVKELRAGQGLIKYSKYWDESQQEALLSFIGDSRIVGHNVMGFDLPHLFGAQLYETIASKFKGGVIDTLMLAEAYRGAGKGLNTLDRLFKETFGMTMEQAGLPHHDALSDVKATALLLQAWASSKDTTRLNKASRWALSPGKVSTKPFESTLDEELNEIVIAGRRLKVSDDYKSPDEVLEESMAIQGMSYTTPLSEDDLASGNLSDLETIMGYVTKIVAAKSGDGYLSTNYDKGEPVLNRALNYAKYLKAAFKKGGRDAMLARMQSFPSFSQDLAGIADFADLEKIIKEGGSGRKGIEEAYGLINNAASLLTDEEEGRARGSLEDLLLKHAHNPLLEGNIWASDAQNAILSNDPGEKGWSTRLKDFKEGLVQAEYAVAEKKAAEKAEEAEYQDLWKLYEKVTPEVPSLWEQGNEWIRNEKLPGAGGATYGDAQDFAKMAPDLIAQAQAEQAEYEEFLKGKHAVPGRMKGKEFIPADYNQQMRELDALLAPFEEDSNALAKSQKAAAEAADKFTSVLTRSAVQVTRAFGGNWWTGESIRQVNVSQFGGLMHDASGLFQGPLRLLQAPLYSFANAESLRRQSEWDKRMMGKEAGLTTLDNLSSAATGVGLAMAAVPGLQVPGLAIAGLGALGKIGGGTSQVYGQYQTRKQQAQWESLRSTVSNLSGIAEIIAIPFKIAAASVSMFSTSLFRLSRGMLGWFDNLSRSTVGASVPLQAYTKYSASELAMYGNLQAGTFHGIDIPATADALAKSVSNFQNSSNSMALSMLGVMGDALEDPSAFAEKLPSLMNTIYRTWSANRQGPGGWLYDQQAATISPDLLKLLVDYKTHEEEWKAKGYMAFGSLFNASTVARNSGGKILSNGQIEAEVKLGEAEKKQAAKDKGARTALTEVTQPIDFAWRDLQNQWITNLAAVLQGKMSWLEFLDKGFAGTLDFANNTLGVNKGSLINAGERALGFAIDLTEALEPALKEFAKWLIPIGAEMAYSFMNAVAPFLDTLFNTLKDIKIDFLTGKISFASKETLAQKIDKKQAKYDKAISAFRRDTGDLLWNRGDEITFETEEKYIEAFKAAHKGAEPSIEELNANYYAMKHQIRLPGSLARGDKVLTFSDKDSFAEANAFIQWHKKTYGMYPTKAQVENRSEYLNTLFTTEAKKEMGPTWTPMQDMVSSYTSEEAKAITKQAVSSFVDTLPSLSGKLRVIFEDTFGRPYGEANANLYPETKAAAQRMGFSEEDVSRITLDNGGSR